MIWFNQGLFGVRPTIVSGVSMYSMLQAGDLVLTVDVAPEEVAVGDIIRFRSGDVDILHRVVEVRNAGGLEFITRGDANNVNDPPLPASAVEGRVVMYSARTGLAADRRSSGTAMGAGPSCFVTVVARLAPWAALYGVGDPAGRPLHRSARPCG